MSGKAMVATERPHGPPSSPYRKKLVQEVARKLQRALDSPSLRAEILRQLFTDIALEVDSRAQERLFAEEEEDKDEEEEGRGADGHRISEKFRRTRDKRHPVCFYEVLAEHFARTPEDAEEVLPLFVKLWSQSLAAQIFTLLFYVWLFQVPAEDTEGYLRYSTAFVEGASTIFWIDLESNVHRFFPLYHYTLNEVLLRPDRHYRVTSQAQRELVLTLSRFYFFYEPADKLLEFFAHFPPFGANMSPADVFVIELTDQLQKLKVEPALLHYLESAKALQGLELHLSTSTRLRTALYGFTSPGGPMYPTRPVRHAAWETLDCLFPVGRNSRLLISLFFRLMHPYYWPMSFYNFVVTSIKATMLGIYMGLVTIWGMIFGRRHSQRRD